MSYLVCCDATVLSFHVCVCRETVVMLGIRYEWWLVGVSISWNSLLSVTYCSSIILLVYEKFACIGFP
jgi:hypothetical protein